MNSKLDDQIAAFKTHVWQNQHIAQRYQRNVHNQDFVTSLKNIQEIAMAVEFSRGRVLDAGAGTGRFTIPLHDAGFDVTGLDVSAEMLAVAREAAGDRPIPLIQGSIFELPFEAATFDTIVSITVLPHFPQWPDIAREYIRVLRPGGRLMFNMCSRENVDFANRHVVRHGPAAHPGDPNYFQAEATPDEVVATLGALGATVIDLIPYDSFNVNYALREALGSANDAIMAELQAAFQLPGALDLWAFIERAFFKHLPLTATYGYMVVAELDGTDSRPHPWSAPQRVALRDPLLNAAAFQEAMGPDFEPACELLHQLLRPHGAIQLLATLNDLIGPHLPVPVDFLSLLRPEARARVLDQLAWRWTSHWHRDLDAAFQHQGGSLAPHLDHEVFVHLNEILRPWVGDGE